VGVGVVQACAGVGFVLATRAGVFHFHFFHFLLFLSR
jgi:hypothetical protein